MTKIQAPPPLTQMQPVPEYDAYQCPRCLRVLRTYVLATRPLAPWCACPQEVANG